MLPKGITVWVFVSKNLSSYVYETQRQSKASREALNACRGGAGRGAARTWRRAHRPCGMLNWIRLGLPIQKYGSKSVIAIAMTTVTANDVMRSGLRNRRGVPIMWFPSLASMSASFNFLLCPTTQQVRGKQAQDRRREAPKYHNEATQLARRST